MLGGGLKQQTQDHHFPPPLKPQDDSALFPGGGIGPPPTDLGDGFQTGRVIEVRFREALGNFVERSEVDEDGDYGFRMGDGVLLWAEIYNVESGEAISDFSYAVNQPQMNFTSRTGRGNVAELPALGFDTIDTIVAVGEIEPTYEATTEDRNTSYSGEFVFSINGEVNRVKFEASASRIGGVVSDPPSIKSVGKTQFIITNSGGETSPADPILFVLRNSVRPPPPR